MFSKKHGRCCSSLSRNMPMLNEDDEFEIDNEEYQREGFHQGEVCRLGYQSEVFRHSGQSDECRFSDQSDECKHCHEEQDRCDKSLCDEDGDSDF
uniref:Uncharacterized protein n=1 Tax=Arion vulgaris TaxID=1028688 RepID=A0A0B7BWH2_9EUPU